MDKTESEAQTEWLELRRYEIQHILGLVADPDEEIHDEELKRLVEENQPIALKRILELENDPWDAGYHNNHAKTKKPSNGKR